MVEKQKLFSPAIAIVLAATMLVMFCFPSTVAMASTYPERVVKLLIVYDDSYEQAMYEQGIASTALVSRLEQMARFAETPFRITWNIHFDVTVMNYEQAFGTDPYVNACPTIHDMNNPNGAYDPDYPGTWHIDEQCQCVANSHCFYSLTSPGHHNSSKRVLYTARNFINQSEEYDAVEVLVGHSLCYYSSGEHKYCGGMALLGGNAFVIGGRYDMVSTERYRGTNLLSNCALLWHEFSHNYGLQDGTDDFTDPNNCSENYPCAMSGGYMGVILPYGIWCPNCLARFDYDRIGTVVGGEG